jgi:hypothetical protein
MLLTSSETHPISFISRTKLVRDMHGLKESGWAFTLERQRQRQRQSLVSAWGMGHGAWCTVYGAWCMVYNVQCTMYYTLKGHSFSKAAVKRWP